MYVWKDRARERSRGADAGPATHLSHPSGHEVRDWGPAGHQRSYEKLQAKRSALSPFGVAPGPSAEVQTNPPPEPMEPLTEPLEGAPVGHSQVLLDDDSDLHSTGNEE